MWVHFGPQEIIRIAILFIGLLLFYATLRFGLTIGFYGCMIADIRSNFFYYAQTVIALVLFSIGQQTLLDTQALSYDYSS